MADLQKSLRSLRNPKQPSTLSGSLGLSVDVINVPNRLGFSYVRLLGNTSEVIQAYNATVSAVYDVPVVVQWDGTKYVVIGRDVNRYTSWTGSPYLPNHAASHGLRGGDTLWITSEQFTPLLVYPSGSSLQIAPYTYNWQGSWLSGGGLVSGITLPSDPTKQKIMLLYVDGPTATPSWMAGTEAPAGLTAKTDLTPYLPSFQMSIGLPVAMVRIPSGTTSYTWDNLYDMRQYFQGSYSGSSGGGIGEAPINGLPYSRENAGWVVSPTGSNYSLPTGSNSILGGFKVGTGLSVSPSGVLSATGGGISGSYWSLLYSDDFTDLSNWTVVDGAWSIGSNILSKTNNDFGHIYLTNYLYVGVCVMECEFRCTASSVPSDSHLGLMWSWDGAGSNAPNAADCRLLFTAGGDLFVEFEAAGTNAWTNINVGSWVQNTWYKLRVVYNGMVFQAYLDDVLVLAAHPTDWIAQPVYVGLRGGDGGCSTDMQVRNFKTWVPVLP